MNAVPPEFGGSLEQQLGRGKHLLNLGWVLNMTSEVVDISVSALWDTSLLVVLGRAVVKCIILMILAFYKVCPSAVLLFLHFCLLHVTGSRGAGKREPHLPSFDMSWCGVSQGANVMPRLLPLLATHSQFIACVCLALSQLPSEECPGWGGKNMERSMLCLGRIMAA